MSDDDKKRKVVKLFEESSKKIEEQQKAHVIDIKGNNNIVGNNNNINTRNTIKNVVQPTSIHITELQAKKLSDLVHKAVEIEIKTGLDIREARKKWWGRVRNHCTVTSYKLIPLEKGEDTIKWMQQEVAKLRPKLRRSDNDAWRKELYTGIWARSKELNLSKSSVYEITLAKLGKNIDSLTVLGEQDLKRLYNIIMKL
jgi:hypothetical protein